VATALVSAILASAAAFGAPTPAEAKTPCAKRGDETITRNGVARVFEKDATRYACTYRRNRAYELFFGQGTFGYSLTRLAGFLVAQDNDDQVRVLNLRTGRVRKVPVQLGAFGAADLVLKDNGSLADIRGVGRDPVRPHTSTLEVRRIDSRGSLILARGNDIDPDSLTLRNSYIRWRQAGVVRGATLR